MTKVLRVKEVNKKDPPSKWTNVFVPPPVFDVKAYQKKLNLIAGLYNDKPILKLEWGGNTKVSKFNQWDDTGMPIGEVILPKYALSRPFITDPDLVEYIPIRRWIIAQYQAPGQYDPDTPETFTNEKDISCVIENKPREGRYEPLIYVGDHSLCANNCCEHKICLGDYKDPSEAELDWIREATYKLQSFNQDPNKPVKDDIINQHIRDSNYRSKKAKENLDEEFDAYWKDWYRTHHHRITDDDPSVHRHGRFKFFKDGKPI